MFTEDDLKDHLLGNKRSEKTSKNLQVGKAMNASDVVTPVDQTAAQTMSKLRGMRSGIKRKRKRSVSKKGRSRGRSKKRRKSVGRKKRKSRGRKKKKKKAGRPKKGKSKTPKKSRKRGRVSNKKSLDIFLKGRK